MSSLPRNAIVVGMPRSGTSLTAAIFARKGYIRGDSARPDFRFGNDHNPFGVFEADDVIAANVDLFRRVGYPHHNTWLFDRIGSDAVSRIAELPVKETDRRLLAAYDAESPWVWKDPRFCFTLAYWWKLMDPTRTGVILVRRNRLDTYRSFRRMGWFVPGTGTQRQRIMDRIEEHLTEAQRVLVAQSIPHVSVNFDEYGQDPAEVTRRLSAFFRVDISEADLNFRTELNHGSPRGRLSGYLRRQLMRLPRRPVRVIERLIPRRVIGIVFPERKFTGGGAPDGSTRIL